MECAANKEAAAKLGAKNSVDLMRIMFRRTEAAAPQRRLSA